VYGAEIYNQPWKMGPLRRSWGLLLARFTGMTASGIVCCTNTVARQFPSWTRARVSVGYSPVGLEYSHGSRERGRSQLGIDPDAPCFVTVGNISRGRGQDVALRALASIRRSLPEVRLVIVGIPHERALDLDYDRELRELAESLDLGDSVLFAGQAGDATDPEPISDVYAAADVVVNPARFEEPYGRVGPEALMAGTPVVATRVGGVPEVLRDGVDALLVPPDDAEALAAAVLRLLRDDALRESLVASGRQRVLERFGAEQALGAWKSVVEPVVNQIEGR
jgi:glycosyltransferase involved in cell wall biosynthesis